MRLFVAIELPDAMRARIASDTHGVRGAVPDARWVDAALLHITVQFLGERDEALLPAIVAAGAGISALHAPFTLTLGGGGAFPSVERPRVVWLGVSPSPVLTALAGQLERAFAELGIESEARDFQAHVTLGRIAKPPGRADRTRLSTKLRALDASHELTVDSLNLMRSTRGPAGSHYTRLAAWRLRGARC